jgi:hypothetical protein
MTAIERTAYPGFARAPQVKELIDLYTPTPADVAFVSTTARGPNQKFALMILLKVFQKLGYFLAPQQIPGAIISHIRGEMKLPEDLVPDITPRTLYKYHAAVLKHLKINGGIKQIRHIALKAISEVVLAMDDPADLINVAIETLVKESCELTAFSRDMARIPSQDSHMSRPIRRSCFYLLSLLLPTRRASFDGPIFSFSTWPSPFSGFRKSQNQPISFSR